MRATCHRRALQCYRVGVDSAVCASYGVATPVIARLIQSRDQFTNTAGAVVAMETV
jgi:hypothetical protein